jgi:hypothetical protein
MDDNLAWTTQLGQAFQSQQNDVMEAIQRLRGEAQNLGNLPNTPQETIAEDNGDIEIEPANPDEMYVPNYPPDLIYYQPGVYCSYGIGLPIGLWLGYDWDWHTRHLFWWGPGHLRPGNWWRETPGQRHAFISQHPAPLWHGGGGVVGPANHWDRGFARPDVSRSFAEPRPRVITVRPAPNIRASAPAVARAEPRAAAAVQHRTLAPSESAGGAFGGFQSGREAHESSFRGQASRAEKAPSFSAPAARGGGGGGGGGSGGGERKGR